ncbi:MAG TPA: MFS transporter, partial [Solimonas sp.]|nr:MFS transporter [Solimonas sp.]
ALAPRLCGWMPPRKAAIALCWTYAAATAIPLLARLSGLLEPGNPALFALVAFQGFISASALSMLTVMLLTMLASQTDHFERQTGRRCEGMIVATNTFARKLAQGVGILIAGMILDSVSFPSGAGRNAVSDPVLDELIVTYLIVEILLFALCTVLLRPRSRTDARCPDTRNTSY